MTAEPTEDYDATLRSAWNGFCDGLKAAGELIFREDAPATELDHAHGIRYLSRYISKALDEKLEYADPLRPQLRVLQTPTSKTFGDNPDCTYWQATLDGAETYRLVGNRGTVHWVRFNATSFDGTVTVVERENLRTEWDGSFEIMIGPDVPDGPNTLRTVPGGPVRLFVRQFFGHWDLEEPMTGRLETIVDHGPPPPLTAAGVAAGLRASVDFIREDSQRWFGYPMFYRDRPNQFVAGSPAFWGDTRKMQVDSGRWVNFCYYDIAPDEVLLLTLRPPECWHWIIELDDFWMNSMDYRYHLSSINMKQALPNQDGSVTVAVCTADPGVANWLDTAGHRTGLLIHRWVDAKENPSPEARLVTRSELAVADCPRRTPAQRAEQLRRMKIGVDRRFPIG